MTNAQGKGWAAVLLVAAISMMLVAAIAAPAQTFGVLHNFCSEPGCADGGVPLAGLMQGTDGNLYGTTASGGTGGTIFKMAPNGALTTIYTFCAQSGCPDGFDPSAGIVQATDGNFYGTTQGGGAYGYGTVFKVTPGGALTTMHSFDSTDGASPEAALIQATDGNFYGTTSGGGSNPSCDHGCGTVFRITPRGKLSTVHSFCSELSCADGAVPLAPLVQGTDGNFYGTTSCLDAYLCNLGTVFKITYQGGLTTLHTFDYADGDEPLGGLIQATDGNFYGTSFNYGAYRGGTIFKITPSGTLTVLFNFCYEEVCTDGSGPEAGIIQASDGNFYGTTAFGGTYANGTVFKLTPAGFLTTLHSFLKANGTNPAAAVLQDTNGEFYGTTADNGGNDECYGGCGTIFGLSVGLGPFVETQPASGTVGTVITILGSNLTGTTSVSFNGSVASFKVEHGTAITTTVPTGATTGPVQVVTPSGTLTSSLNFQVEP